MNILCRIECFGSPYSSVNSGWCHYNGDSTSVNDLWVQMVSKAMFRIQVESLIDHYLIYSGRKKVNRPHNSSDTAEGSKCKVAMYYNYNYACTAAKYIAHTVGSADNNFNMTVFTAQSSQRKHIPGHLIISANIIQLAESIGQGTVLYNNRKSINFNLV